jgi:uncharacterized RDD family membrane protein YckC
MSEKEAKAPPKYASFNARMLASTIDLVLIMLVALPATEWVMDKVFMPVNPQAFLALAPHPEDSHIQDLHTTIANLWRVLREQRVFERTLVENTVQLLFIGAYMIPLWLRYSSSLGKMILRMEIQDVTTGAHMTRKQVILRFIGYVISGMLFTFGFIWMLFNKKRQGWHDLMAHTVVVVKPRKKKQLAS